MRELTKNEIEVIHGGTVYEGWEVVAISGVASGLAFGGMQAYQTLSLLQGLKFIAACSIPTAIAGGLIVGGIELVNWYINKPE